MKILFVRTYCPNKIMYGSEMRGSRFVEYLRKKGNVDLLTLTAPNEQTDMDYIKSSFSNFHHFDQKGARERLSAMEKLLHLLPWQITGHYARDFQRKLDAIVEENQYDLIFVFKLEPVFYFLQLPKKWHGRVVIDFDDILSNLYMNHYKSVFTAVKNSYSLKFYERKSLAQFKRVLVCSRDAVSKIPEKYRRKAGIVPNVFQADKGSMHPYPEKNTKLLFVGSMDYFPNMEGLQWFCDHVWPYAKERLPGLQLLVVGKAQNNPRAVYDQFGHYKDVKIELNVPEVKPYYGQCYACVVPILNGSGTRLKILESYAYGRPVLTTKMGMEGLDFTDKKDIFVFENKEEFCSGYQGLLDAEKYKQVCADGFSVLENKYSPAAFEKAMDENWQVITKGGG